MILSPQFWEWFNIWLVQVLKMVYHETKMVAYRGGHCVNGYGGPGGPSGQGCGSAGRPGPQSPGDTRLGPAPPAVPVTQHLTINLQPVNNVSMHYANKHEHSSSHYANTGRPPNHRYRHMPRQPREFLHLYLRTIY